MPTPHPHARYIRRARKYPLHVRYNPRTNVVGPIYVYVPPPLPYPGGGDQTTPTPTSIDELTEFDGLPSGFAYLTPPSDPAAFGVTEDGIYLIGII